MGDRGSSVASAHTSDPTRPAASAAPACPAASAGAPESAAVPEPAGAPESAGVPEPDWLVAAAIRTAASALLNSPAATRSRICRMTDSRSLPAGLLSLMPSSPAPRPGQTNKGRPRLPPPHPRTRLLAPRPTISARQNGWYGCQPPSERTVGVLSTTASCLMGDAKHDDRSVLGVPGAIGEPP